MHGNLKQSLQWSGALLAILGMIFVALRLHDQYHEIDFQSLEWTIWPVMTGLALIYGFANLMLAAAWGELLHQFGIPRPHRWTVKTFGISQIAKYMPGNLFHLAGRQALGLAAGVPGWPLAKSAAWEFGLIAFTGAIFGLLTLPLLTEGFSATASLILFLIAMSLAAVLLQFVSGQSVARALGCYTAFLAISGLVFILILATLDAIPRQPELIFSVIGAYVLAWLIGLVTPGAPAGVGVRELVLLILLNGVVGDTELILAVLLGRLVTITGDVAFFGMALMIDEKNEQTG